MSVVFAFVVVRPAEVVRGVRQAERHRLTMVEAFKATENSKLKMYKYVLLELNIILVISAMLLLYQCQVLCPAAARCEACSCISSS